MERASRRRWAMVAALLLLTVVVWAPVLGYPFVDLDDGEYVAANPHLARGLDGDSVAWAFSSFYAANWHPLTWLSHLLDVELHGGWAGGHHLTNLALHAANVLLVFLLLDALPFGAWKSAAVAALFAVHPLRVESVAWISERKDLLCACFWLLTVAAYGAWVRRGGGRRYAAVVALFALALLSKPMAVTLPAVLLLLDFWPLRRLASWHDLRARSVEKLPLFALALASAVITWKAQSALGATMSASALPWSERWANAAISVVLYLRDAVWPTALAVFYPHPASVGGRIDRPVALAAAAGLFAVSALALAQRRRRPWLTTGWFAYLVLLLPVAGLLQVGSQARADRYTYLPLLGIFVIVASFAGELVRRPQETRGARRARLAAAVVALAAITLLSVACRRQLATWQSSRTLYERALTVTEGNWLAWNNLGNVLFGAGDARGAQRCFAAALRIKPDHADAWYNSGVARARLGELEAAIAAYQEALRLDPGNADGWVNLGTAEEVNGRLAPAVESYRRALALRPEDRLALQGLARGSISFGDAAGARSLLPRLRAVDPEGARQLEAWLATTRR